MSAPNSPDEPRSTSDEPQAAAAAGEPEVTAAAVDSALQDAESDSGRGGSATPQEQISELHQQVLRAQAELENYRKRSQREMDQQRKYANLSLVRDLAPALDNLQRAIAAADESSKDALRQGVQMVVQLVLQTLEQHGCRQVGEVGEAFNPNFHEAIGQEASDTLEKGVVARVMQVGYVLHDRVVRPAQVFVSSGPAS